MYEKLRSRIVALAVALGLADICPRVIAQEVESGVALAAARPSRVEEASSSESPVGIGVLRPGVDAIADPVERELLAHGRPGDTLPRRVVPPDPPPLAIGPIVGPEVDERGIPAGYVLRYGDVLMPQWETRATYSTSLWPDREVEYWFDDNVSGANKDRFRDAVDEWESETNVSFIETYSPLQAWRVWVRDSSDDENPGNNSPVGWGLGSRVINIFRWDDHYVIMHEIGHTLGFWHEQSRTDRDDFVNIRLDRIEDDQEHNFNLEAFSQNYGPYDFDSVMHYGQCAFSTCDDCGDDPEDCRTIEVLPPNNTVWQNAIGQLDHLSYWDRLVMYFLYPESSWRFVDDTYSGIFESGTFLEPYKTFQQGMSEVPSGGRLWLIQSGEYDGAIGIWDQHVIILAPRGARLGI